MGLRMTKAAVVLLALAWVVPFALLIITPMKTFAEYSDSSQWSLPPTRCSSSTT